MLDKRSRLGNDTGDQLRFKTGEIVNVFAKGTVSIQGKNQARVRELLEVDEAGTHGASVLREAPVTDEPQGVASTGRARTWSSSSGCYSPSSAAPASPSSSSTQDQMERPSDVQGLIYLPFTDSVDETKVVLAKEMDRQRLHVEVAKL